MSEVVEPGSIARRLLLRRAVGVTALVLVAGRNNRARAADAEVVIDNFTFSPSPLTVKVGTTVTWENRDDMPHSVVFPVTKVKSPAMDTDGSFKHTFDQPGTFDYVCGMHPFMRGQVVVQA
ncbi:MAG TPA: cupredoxin family copper-binding protein [Acetobacteraceae bacterium]|jgi:amicyanin|nr:cupredoxin family copper-binding protein [Acetobacteraceae bacterium]